MTQARDILVATNAADGSAELVRVYERVLTQIIRDLSLGITRPSARRTAELIAAINIRLAQLDPRAQTRIAVWIAREVQGAYILGDKGASRELRKLLVQAAQDPTSIKRSFVAINQRQMQGLVDAMQATAKGIEKQIRREIGIAIRRTQATIKKSAAIRRITVDAFVRGRTGQQVSDDIAAMLLGKKVDPEVKERLRSLGFRANDFDRFERIARGQLIQVGGRRFTVRSYSDLVARTQMREAHTVGTLARLKQNGVQHVKISRHRQKVRDICTPYAGKIFYVGSSKTDPAGFRPLRGVINGGPPFHPNCRHVIIPWVITLHTDKAVEAAQASSKAIPARFLGKGPKEVRELVASMSDSELKKAFAEGFGDVVVPAA